MNFFTGKYFFPALVCVSFFLFLSLWTVYEFIQDYSHQCSARNNYFSRMTDIVTEAVNCELQKNNGDVKELETLFKRYVKTSFVKHIRIESHGRDIISVNGNRKYIVNFGSNDYHQIQDAFMVRRKNFITAKNRDKADLIIAFDSGVSLSDINSGGNFLMMFFLAGSIAISFLFLAWSYAIRNRELQLRLASERNKSEHVDELELAAAGLAHETKNPLGIIRGLAQNISGDKANSKKTRKMAQDIMEETDVTTARLGDFLSYAKFRSPNPVNINTKEYIKKITSLLKDDFDNADVKLVISLEPETILADKDMLSQILMNLLTNSLRFTGKDGKITLSIRNKSNKTAELKVEDNGAGIPADILPNILKPYITSSSKGYGIGLAIVKRITEQSGWSIKVNSTLKKGTTVTISNISVVSETA